MFANKPNITHTAANVKAAQRKAVAQDMKSRGLNPVTVSDLKQRHAMPAGRGRSFLSTLLDRG